jgi:hypothetical protein
MKQVLVLDTHSFVDVITNSSTELFVCDTEKSVEQVAGLLMAKLEEYNSNNECSYKFDDVFDYPYVYTKKHLDESNEYAWGWENAANIGKIIICGRSDNSIPYDMWDLINDLFNGHNHHLG